MRNRLRMGAAVGVGGMALVALAGCSALPGNAAASATSPSPAPSTSIPVRTIATPKPRTPAPTLKNTGAAWPAILTSLAGYGGWLLANPDPALVGNVAEPGCAASTLITQQAAGLLADRAYLKPVPAVFGTITGPAPGSTAMVVGSSVTLVVTATRPAESVLSRTGAKPITTFEALPSTGLQITLYRAADARWRLCTVDPIVESEATDDGPVSLL